MSTLDKKIERAKEFQDMLKKGEIKAATAVEKTGINRTTISNLKNDLVDPEKMTEEMLTKLSNFMESSDNPLNQKNDNREKAFGHLLALLEAVSGKRLNKDEIQRFNRMPATVTQKMIEANITSPNYEKYEEKIMSEMNRIEIDDFVDGDLTGKYLLYYYRKREELR